MDSVNDMKGLGETEVFLERRILLRQGQAVPIGERAFDILQLLIRHQGTLVTKEQILTDVWPDSIVVENNLQVHISALRKALGKDRNLIRTLAGRGYLLVNDTPDIDPAESDAQDSPPLAHPRALRHINHLPVVTTLIGRDCLIDHVCQALNDTSILTLTGAGGIGKTALAITVAQRFAQSTDTPVTFVALADLTHPEQVIGALAQALGIEGVEDRTLIPVLIAHLQQSPHLIVLDNCEHLVAVAAQVVEQLVGKCPALTVLATSREPLRVAGERGMRVPPLCVPARDATREHIMLNPSAQLFMRHARQQNSCCANVCDSQLDDQSVELIGEVCRRTEGLPLALEMAATRAATLGLFELALSLQDDLASLAAGLRTTAPRHQSLQASLQWSYRLLEADEQQVLKRIARLEGKLTLERLCNAAEPDDIDRLRAIDCVVGLTQKSLLMISIEGPFRSYRLLESTRACLMNA
jgi:predicted ATPase/DNA-binding winged helix-turn-helix (wHTH) protein